MVHPATLPRLAGPDRGRASKLGQVPVIAAGLRPSGYLVYTSDLLIIFFV